MNCMHYMEPRGARSTRWRGFCKKKRKCTDPAICELCGQKETARTDGGGEAPGKEKNMKIEPEILKNYGVLSTRKNGWTRELNLVSWSGDPEKYDLRDWDPEHEHAGKCGTYTAEELRNLRDILNQMDLEEE